MKRPNYGENYTGSERERRQLDECNFDSPCDHNDFSGQATSQKGDIKLDGAFSSIRSQMCNVHVQEKPSLYIMISRGKRGSRYLVAIEGNGLGRDLETQGCDVLFASLRFFSIHWSHIPLPA